MELTVAGRVGIKRMQWRRRRLGATKDKLETKIKLKNIIV
jgi:hypothetical protein